VFVVNIGGDADDAVAARVNPERMSEDPSIDSRPTEILLGKHALCESSMTIATGLFALLAILSLKSTAGEDGENREPAKESERRRELSRRVLIGGMNVAWTENCRPKTAGTDCARDRQGPNAVLVHTE